MSLKWLPLLALALFVGVWAATPAELRAQARSNDANITMMDNCSENDPAYGMVGGCPEGAPFPGSSSYHGDVSVAEFFALLFSPLTPAGQVIGHPSWRNEPSYISVRAGQNVRVSNRGGRAHTFTEVANFGGGFVPLLNGTMNPAPECNPDEVVFVPYGGSQTLTLEASVQPRKFQCCIHPWMRAAIRVN